MQITVPATSANLGPGFDCMGLALNLSNTTHLTLEEPGQPVPDMIQATAEHFFHATGQSPRPFSWTIRGEVPSSRGLGSSVTVRLGVLAGLNALLQTGWSEQVLFEHCSQLEGHPDNAAPAVFGGFTLAQGTRVQRYDIAAELHIVLLIPDFEVATEHARTVLPQTLSLNDAVTSAAHAAWIAAALASGNYSHLRGAFEDRIHQPYRAKLIPFFDTVRHAAQEAGALDAYISGSGSTLAAITQHDPQAVADAMQSHCPDAQVLVTQVANQGLQISA
ncbi:MAG: homoserine kinase [Verrucomicrobiales bacterium]